ncbi:MAG: thioredoxin family protein [Planctomycetota bacterium]
MDDLGNIQSAPNARRGRIDWFWVVMIALLFGFYWYMGRTAPTPDIFAASVSLDEAIELSAREGKPVFAVATADWCSGCQVYKRGALANSDVEAWLRENAIPVYINIDSDPTSALALGVNGIPATFVIDEGEIRAHLEGAYGAEELLDVLERSRKN